MLRLLIALLIVSYSAIIPAKATSPQVLRIHGSNTVGASLVPGLLDAWLNHKGYQSITKQQLAAQEHRITAKNVTGETIQIELHAHGSSTAFINLAAGTADLGMSSRPIKQKEVNKLAFLGDMSQAASEYVIALDGLSVIVNKQNPLNSIKKHKLKQIFSGVITHWSQLGISGGRINVYARDNKSGTYDTFKSLVLDKKTHLLASAKRYESNANLSDDVSKDRNGIGFVGLAYVRQSKALAIADEGTTALKPLPFNVSTEDYALARRLFLYLPKNNRKPLLKEFTEFAISPAAQTIVDKVGFVSQKIHTRKNILPEHASLEYKTLTKGAKRLSLNIRFKQGEVRLDNKAVRDIQRLVEFEQRAENRNKKIMLFGFSDNY